MEYIMETPRLKFRKFKYSDFEDFFRLNGDFEVMEFITGAALTREQALKRFEENMQINDNQADTGYYHVSLKENGQFVGLGKLAMLNTTDAEIGYSILTPFWGMGFATEIAERLMRHARSLPSIKKLVAITDPRNEASNRIVQKWHFMMVDSCEMDGLPALIYELEIKVVGRL
jgi:RimJ/RimL family protein N-acetyltransferase